MAGEAPPGGAAPAPPPVKRGRGRPKGSKDKKPRKRRPCPGGSAAAAAPAAQPQGGVQPKKPRSDKLRRQVREAVRRCRERKKLGVEEVPLLSRGRETGSRPRSSALGKMHMARVNAAAASLSDREKAWAPRAREGEGADAEMFRMASNVLLAAGGMGLI